MLLGVALAGCAPGQRQADDEKEPHYVLGQSRVNGRDYQGAVEAFEESLEANPRSAAAHYQLAILFDTEVSDPAAAIYHYQQYLKFNPAAPNSDVITGRIGACKQQLAANVLQLPAASSAQQQLERLAETNRVLQEQVAQLQDTVKRWNAYYASELAARSNASPQNSYMAQPATSPLPDNITLPTAAADTLRPRPAPARPVRARTYTVVKGETAAAISRKFGVKLSALGAANPGVNLARIRAGQVLNLPPP